ncbi:MAG: FAD-dependent oxidoreductase [Armatimonadota bacterium]|nr:FAD-dependent oxidoreductase [Armatimonadota bacterium]
MNPASHLHHEQHEFDVCVIGGGMAGMCAAIAAARNGAKTALVHDRPVFGGNASSEVRMWICGAHGKHNKETGLLEEIQLENQYRNPALNYSIWDSVLYGKVYFQPNLTPFINCSCTNAEMDGDKIVGIRAWQLTTQTWHTIQAKYFVDCSGDSILAAVTPAEWRSGREARAEFDEDIEPFEADGKTMGNTLLIQLRRTHTPQPYTPPRWAYKFTRPEDLPHRMRGVQAHNFWWLEVGGLNDTIRDAESIRDELMKVVYGVWDYIKNYAPEREQAAHWAIEWIGALPGKRENRRYVGDHILTQNDVRASGAFEDIVAYGGWSMDDHHPAGIFYPGYPTIFHPAPSPYGIPYRSLYSRNIANLLFAGRNISVTHAALSSTRVMATCAIIGQAAGTAAALCVRHNCAPRSLSSGPRLSELQRTLMDDDCWLPGLTRPVSRLAQEAKLSGEGQDVARLLDGLERDRENESHAWTGRVGSALKYSWNQPVQIAGVRCVFDSNLSNEKRMPCSYPQKGDRNIVPSSLVKQFRVEAMDDSGHWRIVHRESDNYQRLVVVPLQVQTKALRLVPEETWGDEAARIFTFEPLETCDAKIPAVPDGPPFSEVRAKLNSQDLAPPDSGLEKAKIGHSA